jgi:hypothetical protein
MTLRVAKDVEMPDVKQIKVSRDITNAFHVRTHLS